MILYRVFTAKSQILNEKLLHRYQYTLRRSQSCLTVKLEFSPNGYAVSIATVVQTLNSFSCFCRNLFVVLGFITIRCYEKYASMRNTVYSPVILMNADHVQVECRVQVYSLPKIECLISDQIALHSCYYTGCIKKNAILNSNKTRKYNA